MRNNIHTENEKNSADDSGLKFSAVRPARVIFCIVMFLAALAVMWPGYALFSSATPLILGFPLSFMWIIAWVIISFTAMLALYYSDKKAEEAD